MSCFLASSQLNRTRPLRFGFNFSPVSSSYLLIMESINSLHGHKTLIIIAHRLQTIEKCDIVYRVEHGEIERER